MHGTTAAGSNAHQKGGAARGAGRSGGFIDNDLGEQLIGDYAYLGQRQSSLSETATIHAAISHALGESEPVRLSSAQLADFKLLLNRPRPGNESAPGLDLQATWYRDGESDLRRDLLRGLDDEAPGAQLAAAAARPYVKLPEELAPRHAQDEALLFLLTTDPRAGFRPEGVAAFAAFRRYGLNLEEAGDARYDFVDAQTQEGWRTTAPCATSRPTEELHAAVAAADAVGAHALLDATTLPALPDALRLAVKELGGAKRRRQTLAATGPAHLVFPSGVRAA